MLGWVLIVTGVALTAQSPWWLLLSVAAAIPKLHRRILYSGEPWRQLHYELERGFARAAGFESGRSQTEGRAYDIHQALAFLLQEVQPPLSLDAKVRVLAEQARVLTLSDEEALDLALRGRLPSAEHNGIPDVLEELATKLSNPDDSARKVAMIAAVIRERHGPKAQADYLAALILGQAR